VLCIAGCKMLESSLFSECSETAVIFLLTFTVSAHLIKQITVSTDSMVLTEYNQKDATFHNLFISVRRSTCFRRFSVHHQELKTVHTVSGIGLVLYVQF